MSMNQRPVSVTADKLAAVDALRGWAILLVVVSHASGLFTDLPYPVKRVSQAGWFGVQLFFIVSAFTLMRSWQAASPDFLSKTRRFMIRRFFRIAPPFYLAALVYLFISPPLQGFDWSLWLSTLSFVSAWTPGWMTTVADQWLVVRGSWSISVEFCFYFAFPFIASWIVSSARAWSFFLFSVGLACVAPSIGRALFLETYGQHATDLFLFFWFPNQLVVFALGFVLYFAVSDKREGVLQKSRDLLVRHQSAVLMFCAAGFVGLTYIALPAYVDASMRPPMHFVVAMLFTIVALSLIGGVSSSRIAVNTFMCRLGEASFSAYLIHWAILDLAHSGQLKSLLVAQGWNAVAYFVLVAGGIIAITYALSRLTYRWIELPAIQFGRRVE